jgi:hypothetical protein
MTESITSRIDNVTKIPSEFLSPVLPPPKSVKVELTGECDFQCFFCATGKHLREQSHMDMGRFRKIAKGIRDAGVQEIGLFYLGESFLHPGLPEAIAYCKEIGFPYVFLTTNGNSATPERVRACISAGLDSLKFSYNWADAKQCQAVTRVNAFERVTQHIQEAFYVRQDVEAATGHRCNLYASSIQYDGEQQDKMEAAVAHILPYLDQHYWLPLYNQAGFRPSKNANAGNIGRIGALRDPLPCWAVLTEGHVSWEGKLSACCFDHDGRFEMGDLNTQEFMDAWNSETFQELRAAHLAKDVTGTVCEGCVAYN